MTISHIWCICGILCSTIRLQAYNIRLLIAYIYNSYALWNGNQLDQHYEESFLVGRGEGGAVVCCNTRISFNAIASVNNNNNVIYATASLVHSNNKHSV